jgi:hypothetical protein
MSFQRPPDYPKEHCEDPFNGCCISYQLPGYATKWCHCKCSTCKENNYDESEETRFDGHRASAR